MHCDFRNTHTISLTIVKQERGTPNKHDWFGLPVLKKTPMEHVDVRKTAFLPEQASSFINVLDVSDKAEAWKS